jgi:hypothetical protein
MASQIGARLVFDNAKALVQNAGFSVGQAVLSQSYIRSEVALSASTTSYHIPVLVNDTQQSASAFNTENRLQLQDAFVVSSIGIFVAAPGSATDTEFKLYSYNNAVTFSGAGEADALLSLYNGNLSWVVNNRQIIPSWPVMNHFVVPQTQEDTQAGGNSGFDQFDSETGFFPMEPNAVLVGSKNNQISINLPSALAAVKASSRLVVIFRGILAQNVTPVR